MINIVTQVAVTLVASLILMLASTNLIGMLVRGFFTAPEMENVHDAIKNEYVKGQRATNIIALVLIIIFLGALYHFWNIGLVIAALMLMASRVPDLIWEIRNGRKLEMSDMARPKFHLLSMVLSWASLPVVWYALYGR